MGIGHLTLTRYRAAIPDGDGTMFHSDPTWAAAKRRLMARLGVEVPQATNDACVGRGARGVLTGVPGPALTGDHRTDLANQIGAKADVLRPHLRQPIPGAAPLVIRQADRDLSLPSALRRHSHPALDQLTLLGRAGAIMFGAEVPRGKPEPLPSLEPLWLLDLGLAEAFGVDGGCPE